MTTTKTPWTLEPIAFSGVWAFVGRLVRYDGKGPGFIVYERTDGSLVFRTAGQLRLVVDPVKIRSLTKAYQGTKA